MGPCGQRATASFPNHPFLTPYRAPQRYWRYPRWHTIQLCGPCKCDRRTQDCKKELDYNEEDVQADPADPLPLLKHISRLPSDMTMCFTGLRNKSFSCSPISSQDIVHCASSLTKLGAQNSLNDHITSARMLLSFFLPRLGIAPPSALAANVFVAISCCCACTTGIGVVLLLKF